MLTIRPFPGTAWFLNDYRFEHDGPTFFPLVESWAWLVLVIVVIAMFLTYLWRCLRITHP